MRRSAQQPLRAVTALVLLLVAASAQMISDSDSPSASPSPAQPRSVLSALGGGAQTTTQLGVLGWNAAATPPQNNLNAPRTLLLSLDGSTLFMAHDSYGAAPNPNNVPASAQGSQILSMAVTGGGAVSSTWTNVVGGNPTPACNYGIIDGTGTNAMFPSHLDFCADASFSNFYVTDQSVSRFAAGAGGQRATPPFSLSHVNRLRPIPIFPHRTTSSARSA